MRVVSVGNYSNTSWPSYESKRYLPGPYEPSLTLPLLLPLALTLTLPQGLKNLLLTSTTYAGRPLVNINLTLEDLPSP